MNEFKPPKHLGKELFEPSENPTVNSSETPQDFEVPEHVTQELGRTAGETSSAHELLDNTEVLATPDYEEAQRQGEIAIYSALKSWQKYDEHPDFKIGRFKKQTGIPKDLEQFKEQHNYFAQALSNIYFKYQNIKNAEWPICDAAQPTTTRIILIPYRFFYDNLQPRIDGAPSLVYSLIELSGGERWADRYSLSPEVYNSMKYKDPKDSSRLLELRDYAKAKMEQEGDWGIALSMLAPAHPQGINPLTPIGFANHPQVRQHQTDKFGLLEWFSLNLQEGSQPDPDYYDFMSAHITDNGAYYIINHNGAIDGVDPTMEGPLFRKIMPRFRLAINGD